MSLQYYDNIPIHHCSLIYSLLLIQIYIINPFADWRIIWQTERKTETLHTSFVELTTTHIVWLWAIIRQHHWKRFHLLVLMLPFRGLFVCLSVCYVRALCWNGRKYRHDFFCKRKTNVSPRYSSNLAYIDQPFPPQILLKTDSPTC